MEKITEICIGELTIGAPGERKAFLIDQINKVIKPPRPASDSNVNIRAMYILNDLVNSHGGRFEREELATLCGLMNDTPVLVGHNRSEAPLARTFHAELESKGDVLWIKSYFYWPGQNNADQILEKIDSGILKECSISFVYTIPQCSVCGEDMRKCRHGLNSPEESSDKPHFLYKGVLEVLETSLVYKGSVKGTFVTDKLSLPETVDIRLDYANHTEHVDIPKIKLSGNTAVVTCLKNSGDVIPKVFIQDKMIKSTIATRRGELYLLTAAL